eukprot:25938-Eustigmatos_ZCMA.PRE.1
MQVDSKNKHCSLIFPSAPWPLSGWGEASSSIETLTEPSLSAGMLTLLCVQTPSFRGHHMLDCTPSALTPAITRPMLLC